MKKMIFVILLALLPICFGVAPALESFNLGQVSRELDARSDFSGYRSACRTVENMLPVTMGPVRRRTGTKYITDCNSPVRLIPFTYSTDDSYVLEVTDGCMRFYRTDPNNDGGIIQE